MTGRFHGAKLVLTCGDGLLLLLRDDIPTIQWPGHWDLPGGGREGDETPEACALRELEEETGLRLAPERLRGRAQPSVNRPGGVAWVFRGELTPQEVAAVRLGDEGQELRLMPRAEYFAHPKAIPHFRDMAAEILNEEARA